MSTSLLGRVRKDPAPVCSGVGSATRPGKRVMGGRRATGDTGAMATQTAPSGTRWRALGALLRPDALRWAGLGVLVGDQLGAAHRGAARRAPDRRPRIRGRPRPPRSPDSPWCSWRSPSSTQILAVIVVWLATVAAWRTTNDLRLDDDPPRARSRPRVPPPPHAGRADPACRRRRHLGVRLPRHGRPEGGRCGHAHRRDDHRADRARLAPRARHGDLCRAGAGGHHAQPASGGLGVVRGDGCARPALRRHRGTADRGRGPARQRRGRPRRLAVRRGQRGRADERGASRAAFLAMWWVVQGAVAAGWVVAARARCGARGRRHHHRSARRSCCSSTCC